LLDWIDIHIEVPRVDYDKLSSERVGESSATIRARVQTARFQLISDGEEAAELEENAEYQRLQTPGILYLRC
jgi:magnesium chelatase family protein